MHDTCIMRDIAITLFWFHEKPCQDCISAGLHNQIREHDLPGIRTATVFYSTRIVKYAFTTLASVAWSK